ncbi:hypothetical protein B0H10DRAFT_1939301 [Mycena sp. CBHHK59/15]|nr:hypothetical protein B0H10DRAFT_1939301 [Mycena sp. CBHHK59/15]
MWYGTNDPTLRPRQWTVCYCHLPAIARKGTCPELEIMWWDPSPADFIIGNLQQKSPASTSPLFGELIQNILMWIEQLQSLPTTYPKMVFGVTSLQHAFLELDAVFDYMTIHKPFLHHWTLLSDGFRYMLSQQRHVQLLSAQEWRDILEGLMTKHGCPDSRTYRWSAKLKDRIHLALEASNITSVEGFPVPVESLPQFSVDQICEIVWQVTEMSFHFEFSSLDIWASKKHQLDEVKVRFAGHMLIGVPLELSKCSLAVTVIEEMYIHQPDATAPKSEHCYVPNTAGYQPPPTTFYSLHNMSLHEPMLLFLNTSALSEEPPGAIPVYETTAACNETGAKT